jgi:hypothetical protein
MDVSGDNKLPWRLALPLTVFFGVLVTIFNKLKFARQ